METVMRPSKKTNLCIYVLLIFFLLPSVAALAEILPVKMDIETNGSTTVTWQSDFWISDDENIEMFEININWKTYSGKTKFNNFYVKEEVQKNKNKSKAWYSVDSIDTIDNNTAKIVILTDGSVLPGDLQFVLMLDIDENGDGKENKTSQYGVNIKIGGDRPLELYSTLAVEVFGNGVVLSADQEISCVDECYKSYPTNTIVSLTAYPDSNSEFLHWSGCDIVQENTCWVTLTSDRLALPTFGLKNFELSDATRVLSEELNDQIEAIEEDRIIFSRFVQRDFFTKGDILISTRDYGFLKEVKEVHQDSAGRTILTTENSTLVAAIKQGTIAFKKTITVDDIKSIEYFSDEQAIIDIEPLTEYNITSSTIHAQGEEPCILFPFNQTIGNGAVNISGSTKFCLDLDVGLQIGYTKVVIPHLEQFKMILTTGAEQNINIKTYSNYESYNSKPIELARMTLHPIYSGPVVFVPVLRVYFGYNVGVYAVMTVDSHASYYISAGVKYKNGDGWSPVKTVTKNLNVTVNEFSGQVYLEAYAGPEFALLLYNLAGPYINLEGFARGVARSDPLAWSVNLGLRSHLGVKIDFLGWEIANYYTYLFNIDELVATNHGPKVKISNKDPYYARIIAGNELVANERIYTLTNSGTKTAKVSIKNSMRDLMYPDNTPYPFIQWGQVEIPPGGSYDVRVALKNKVTLISYPQTLTGDIQITADGGFSIIIPTEIKITHGPLVISTPEDLPDGKLNTAYQVSLQSNYGLLPYNYSVYPGDTLPPGLSLESSGVLAGIPVMKGEYAFRIAVKDGTIRLIGEPLTNKLFYLNVYGTLRAPVLLVAQPISPAEIELFWKFGEPIAGYNIYQDGKFIATSGVTDFTASGLEAGTEYCYTVTAFNYAGEESPASESACATTPIDRPPTAPTNLIAFAPSTSEVSLNWQASEDDFGIAGYDIFRNDDYFVTVSGLEFLDTNLLIATRYCYFIVAKDTFGNESLPSQTACVTTNNDSTPPSVPEMFTAIQVYDWDYGMNGIHLNWEPSQDDFGVGGYRVYVTQLTASPYGEYFWPDGVLWGDTQETFFDFTSGPNWYWCLTVSAYDLNGNESPQSEPACIFYEMPH
jgi:hypothetical protein